MALDALTGVLPQEAGDGRSSPIGESLRQQIPSEWEIRTNARAGLGNHIAQAGESPKMSGRASGLKAALGGGWGKTPEQPISDVDKAAVLSFPDRDRISDLKEAVGMDEFYAKLAQYVRRAESGDETLVTRWGKPVARLVPVASNTLPACR